MSGTPRVAIKSEAISTTFVQMFANGNFNVPMLVHSMSYPAQGILSVAAQRVRELDK